MIPRLLWLAAAVLVLDQLTKQAALMYLPGGDIEVAPFLNFVLVFNAGAAFGFLNDAGGWQNLFFVVIALIVSVVIIVSVRQLPPDDLQTRVALMLILGGALGNVIDRLRFGYVVDFIDFYYRSWHWYTFNVADAAITIGAGLLLFDTFGARFARRRA